jgi:hypothetical protein
MSDLWTIVAAIFQLHAMSCANWVAVSFVFGSLDVAVHLFVVGDRVQKFISHNSTQGK